MRNKLIIFLSIVLISKAYAQPSGFAHSRMDYIEMYKEQAIREMLLNGIPASITLAQGMLESGNGNSPLATYANNHFGIKCHKDWNGFSFTLDDDASNECFRKYASVTDSYSDHSRFIRTRRWYAPLFQLKITDYKGWAYGLKKAGYATHPRYAEMLIEIIEENNLNEYDKLCEIDYLTTFQPEIEPFLPQKAGNE
jgi:flagellum-specific peptidoglycan hydrolase FlgJ